MQDRDVRTVGNLDMLVALVAFMSVEAFHVVRHMVGGAGVHVPVGVAGVAFVGVGVVGHPVRGLWLDRVIEPRVAPQGVVAVDATDMASRFAAASAPSSLSVAVMPRVAVILEIQILKKLASTKGCRNFT